MSLSIHADLTQRVVVDATSLPWVSSPLPGVRRRMLERDGGEVARATSIVQYVPGASFDAHVHELGEEIFVLEGEFSDDLGTYRPGTYIKNPPGSSHAPHSTTGCTLFVKLRHLPREDSERVVLETGSARWQPGLVPGLSVMQLSVVGTQHTALVRWAPGTVFSRHRHYGGEEIFVIDGTFEDEHGAYPTGTWTRSPHQSEHTPFSRAGCTIWVKVGHLV